MLLINLDPSAPVQLKRGDRIAQLVFQQVERARFVEVERPPRFGPRRRRLRFYRRGHHPSRAQETTLTAQESS